MYLGTSGFKIWHIMAPAATYFCGKKMPAKVHEIVVRGVEDSGRSICPECRSKLEKLAVKIPKRERFARKPTENFLRFGGDLFNETLLFERKE